MAALKEILREWIDKSKRENAVIACWMEETTWESRQVTLNSDGMLHPEDAAALRAVLKKDPHALLLDSVCGIVSDYITVEEMEEGLKASHELPGSTLEEFLDEHEDFVRELSDKVSKEQDQYRNWLRSQYPDTILAYSHDFALRENIVAALKNGDEEFSVFQAKVMLSLPNTLEFLRKEYERSDPNTLGRTWDTLQEVADRLNNSLDKAMNLINDFWREQYWDLADFSDLHKVFLVNTTMPTTGDSLQVTVDLLNCRLERCLNGKSLDGKQWGSLGELVQNGLANLKYKDLVNVDIPLEQNETQKSQAHDTPPEAGSFSIYHLKQETYTFMLLYNYKSYEELHNDGLSVEFSNYEKAHTGPLHEGDTLDDLFSEVNQPFTGCYMSVTDVVVLHQNGEDTAYYCDKCDVDSFTAEFREVPEFLGREVKPLEQEEEMEL